MAKIKAYSLIGPAAVGNEDVLLIETEDGTKTIHANDLVNPYSKTSLDSLLAGKESLGNKKNEINDNTDEYPSSKAVYDALAEKESTDNRQDVIRRTSTEYPSSKAVFEALGDLNTALTEAFTTALTSALTAKESLSNKKNEINNNANEYPSSKAVYDALANKQSISKITISNINAAIDVHKVYEVYESHPDSAASWNNCLGHVIFVCQDANLATPESPVNAVQIWFTSETDSGRAPIKYRNATVVDGDSPDMPVIGSWDSSWTTIAENVDYLTNIIVKGSYHSTANHGYPIQYTDITAGKRYGVHLWNIVGNVASSPKVYVVFPDGHSPANIQIDDSGVDNGAMSATVVVPDDAVRIQVYLAKDENAEYAAADFALVDLDKTVTGNIEKRLSAIESTYMPSLWDAVTNVVTKGSYAAVSNGEVFQYQNVIAGNRYKVHLWDIVGNSSAANPRIYILSPDGNIEIKHSGVVDGALHVSVIVPQGATAIRVYMNKHADAPFASANYALVDEGVASVGNKLTCKIFKRVVCCGDSFTSGYIKLDASTVSETNEEYAWPHYLSTMTGNEWLNCGQHGKTVLSWPTAGRGLPKAQTLGTAQAYVIGLMINDARQTGGVPAVPVGTASDIGTDNPTTYYGGLAKIIRELNAISPRAKIFVNTIPETNPIYTDYNTAVRTVVNTYAGTYPVHCIDLYEYRNLYNIPSLVGDKLNSHYTAIGYEQFAEIYAYILSDYINTHISAFRDVYSLPYEGDGDSNAG